MLWRNLTLCLAAASSGMALAGSGTPNSSLIGLSGTLLAAGAISAAELKRSSVSGSFIPFVVGCVSGMAMAAAGIVAQMSGYPSGAIGVTAGALVANAGLAWSALTMESKPEVKGLDRHPKGSPGGQGGRFRSKPGGGIPDRGDIK